MTPTPAMSRHPEVSVVMSVRDGERYLRESLESVLAQEDVDLELIVVNDGSRDGSGAILAEIAGRDPRVRVLEQENAGLTRALIRGCAAARGEFVARQDADDLSLPGRLRRQVELLRADPHLSFASCWSEAIGPRDELLLVQKRPSDPYLATEEVRALRHGPPGHGSVTFRRAAYEAVGGYRPEFYYAQDMDLWLRLTLVGRLGYVPAILYRYRVAPGSISGGSHAKAPYHRLVQACHAARLAGEEEGPLLEQAAALRGRAGRRRDGTDYFIGRCLLARRDRRAAAYFARCLRGRPLHWKAWLSLAVALPLYTHAGAVH